MQVLIRINYLFILIASLLLIGCKSGKDHSTSNMDVIDDVNSEKEQSLPATKIIVLKDSILINGFYAVFEELEIVSSDIDRAKKLQKEIQNSSVNEELKSIEPEKRLITKKKLFSDCFKSDQIIECRYSPEGYQIINNTKGILTIKYSYNQFSSHDQFFKYLTLDLQEAKLLDYSNVFINPEIILKSFNNDYNEYFQEVLDDLDVTKDEDQDEFDIIKNHLEERTPFDVNDLNNYEFVYKDGQIISIRFHYNGMGGVYSSVISNDYIEYEFSAISDNISNQIKNRL